DPGYGLRNDNVAIGSPGREIQCACGFPLSSRDRFDTSAINFRRIGRILKTKCQSAGQKCRQNNAVYGQHVIEEKQLHQQWCITQELNYNRRWPGYDLVWAATQKRKDKAKDQRNCKARGGGFQSHGEANRQNWQNGNRERESGRGVPGITVDHAKPPAMVWRLRRRSSQRMAADSTSAIAK